MTRLPDNQKKCSPQLTSVIHSSGHPVIWLCIALIRFYQLCVSPWLGARCRFEPSCSHYAAQAVETHGLAKGVVLATRRLLRCHPFSHPGYDPVPPSHKK